MITPQTTDAEVREIALQALRESLGLVGTIRFLQQLEGGYDDYTAQRQEWLDEGSVQDLAEEIIRARPAAGSG